MLESIPKPLPPRQLPKWIAIHFNLYRNGHQSRFREHAGIFAPFLVVSLNKSANRCSVSPTNERSTLLAVDDTLTWLYPIALKVISDECNALFVCFLPHFPGRFLFCLLLRQITPSPTSPSAGTPSQACVAGRSRPCTALAQPGPSHSTAGTPAAPRHAPPATTGTSRTSVPTLCILFTTSFISTNNPTAR